MDQKNLLTQALGLIRNQRQHRWWLRVMTGMAAVVVFVTTYLLILPAITVENSIFELTAALPEAVPGETIQTEIYAEADDGREKTYFVLTADGDNAGLDERQLNFDEDGVAAVEDLDGQEMNLHREYTENGEARFWFVLERGEAVRLSLPWVNGVDRYRTETVEEEIPDTAPPMAETPPAVVEEPEETPPAVEEEPEETPPVVVEEPEETPPVVEEEPEETPPTDEEEHPSIKKDPVESATVVNRAAGTSSARKMSVQVYRGVYIQAQRERRHRLQRQSQHREPRILQQPQRRAGRRDRRNP